MGETVVFTQHQKMLRPLELVCLLGPEKGKRFSLAGGRQTFGRSQGNDIVLPDPTISDHHGTLVYSEESEVLFYDTASKNGISVDGKRGPILRIRPGQKIQIGSVYLKLVSPGGKIDAVPLAFSVSGLILVILLSALLAGSRAIRPPGAVLQNSAQAPALSVKASYRPRGPRRAEAGAHPSRQKLTGLVEASQLADQAAALFDQGNFRDAYGAWKQVLTLDPANQPAQEGLQKLKSVAERFYEEAMMAKVSSPDEFRRKIDVVLAISDQGSELYTKAHELVGT